MGVVTPTHRHFQGGHSEASHDLHRQEARAAVMSSSSTEERLACNVLKRWALGGRTLSDVTNEDQLADTHRMILNVKCDINVNISLQNGKSSLK